MYKAIVLRLLKTIFFGLFPAFLIYVGKDDYLTNWLVTKDITQETQQESIKFYSFLIGILWAAVANPVYFAYYEHKMDNRIKRYEGLMHYTKVNFLKYLKSELRINNGIFLYVRIFGCSKNLNHLFWRAIKGSKYLVMRNVNGLTDEFHSDGLIFKVKSNEHEGMVGKTFKEKKIHIDLDLTTQNSYRLTKKQAQYTADTRFCASVPIFSRKSEKVKYVLSLDSEEKLNLDKDKINVLTQNLRYFAALVDKNIN